jgi:hypothetical protein
LLAAGLANLSMGMFRPIRCRHEPRPEAVARATRHPWSAHFRLELNNVVVEHSTMFDGNLERIDQIHVAGVKDILFMPAQPGPPAKFAPRNRELYSGNLSFYTRAPRPGGRREIKRHDRHRIASPDRT